MLLFLQGESFGVLGLCLLLDLSQVLQVHCDDPFLATEVQVMNRVSLLFDLTNWFALSKQIVERDFKDPEEELRLAIPNLDRHVLLLEIAEE